MIGCDLPLLRQHQPAGRAPEQRHAQILLETPNLVADGGGRDAQLTGGLRETRQPGGGLEGTQRGQRRQ